MFINDIQCKYRIHDYLLDNQFILDDLNLSFTTNFTKCLDLFNFNDGLYLLICQQNFSIIAQIINEGSMILDQIVYKYKENNNVSFTYSQGRILFYEVDTVESNFEVFAIAPNNLFNKEPIQGKIKSRGQKLKNVKFLEGPDIQMTFEYHQVQSNFMNLKYENLKYVMKDDFHYLNQNQGLVFGISDNKTEYQYYKDVFCLGMDQLKLPTDVISIMNNVVLVYEDEFVIIFSRMINFTVSGNHRYVSQISNLPYLLAITQDYIFFYRIFVLPRYISKENNQFAFVYFNVHLNFFEIQRIIRYNLQAYSIENPKIIIKSEQLKPLLLKDNEKLSLSNEIFSGIPIDFQQCQSNQQIVSIKQQIHLINCTYQQQIKIILLNPLQDLSSIFAFTMLNSSVIIQKCDNLKIITKPEAVLQNIENIYINHHTSSVVYVQKGHIYHFEFQNNQQVLQLVNEQDFSSRIQQVKFILNDMLILFENCTILQYNFLTRQFSSPQISAFQTQFFYSNCTLPQYYDSTVIIFNQNKLRFLSKFTYSKIFSFTKIIDCDLIGQNLIVYELHQNKIKGIVYCLRQRDIFQLYDLPTYNYTFNYPLLKQVSNIYLAISATLINQQVILIYRISNTVPSSLRKVIKIDNNSNFDFVGKKGSKIFYINQNQIYFEDIEELVINIQINKNKFIEEHKIFCLLRSQISTFTKKFDLKIIVINQFLQIELLDQDYLDLTETNIISLKNVLGVINDLELLNQSEDFSIFKPLHIIQSKQFECNQRTNLICYKHPNLIYDYFGRNQTLILNDEIQLLTINPLSRYNYSVIFQNNSADLQLSYLSHSNNDQFWQFSEVTILQNDLNFSIKKQVSNLFLVQYQQQSHETFWKQKLFFVQNNQIQFLTFSKRTDFFSADISCFQNYFLIVIAENFNISFYIAFSNSSEFSDTITKEYKISDIISRPEFFDTRFNQFFDVRIMNYTLLNSVLFVQLSIFQKINQGYIYDILLNLDDDQFSYQLKQVIRYGEDKRIEQIFYCQQNLIILQFALIKEYSSIYFYDLDTSKQIVDSYFEIKEKGILSIDKFNETHLTMFSSQYGEESGIYNYSLIKVVGYQLKTKKNQLDKNLSILIKNDVKDFETFINLKQKQQFKKNYFQQILIFVNLTVIICFLFLKKKKLTQRQFDVVI